MEPKNLFAVKGKSGETLPVWNANPCSQWENPFLLRRTVVSVKDMLSVLGRKFAGVNHS